MYKGNFCAEAKMSQVCQPRIKTYFAEVEELLAVMLMYTATLSPLSLVRMCYKRLTTVLVVISSSCMKILSKCLTQHCALSRSRMALFARRGLSHPHLKDSHPILLVLVPISSSIPHNSEGNSAR